MLLDLGCDLILRGVLFQDHPLELGMKIAEFLHLVMMLLHHSVPIFQITARVLDDLQLEPVLLELGIEESELVCEEFKELLLLLVLEQDLAPVAQMILRHIFATDQAQILPRLHGLVLIFRLHDFERNLKTPPRYEINNNYLIGSHLFKINQRSIMNQKSN